MQTKLINTKLNVNGWYAFGRANKPIYICKFCKITPTGYNFLSVVSDNCFKSLFNRLLYENPKNKKTFCQYKGFIVCNEVFYKASIREICEQEVKNIAWRNTTDENIEEWKLMWDNLIKINDNSNYKFKKIMSRLYKMEDEVVIQPKQEIILTNPIMQMEIL